MRIVEAIAAIFLLLMLLAYMIVPVIDDWGVITETEVFESTTGVGVTTQNCQLTYNVVTDNIADISVASTNTSDTPIVTNYVDTTKLVTVGGLAESDSRYLTLDYPRDGDDRFNIKTWLDAMPVTLLVISLFSAIAGLFYVAKKYLRK